MQYVYYNDTIDYFRDGVRDGQYVIDKVIGPLAWAGVEGVDWECIWSAA